MQEVTVYDNFFVSNQNFTTNFQVFPVFFFKNSQIPGLLA